MMIYLFGTENLERNTKSEVSMAQLMGYLERAVADGASDLFIVAGGPVTAKVDGHLSRIGEQRMLPDDTKELISEIYEAANRPMDDYIRSGDDDFSFAVPGLARFRVNAYRQRGSLAAVVRVVSFDIPDWQAIGIPQLVMDLADMEHGMILVTGTAGSGKSTTQACIIDRINKTRDCHVITLEDPIEFLHRNQCSIVSQREIAVDTEDYLSALRACLRQAPDVILLGEMRDAETIRTAITAAETGHLLMATLHTKGAVNAIDRIIDSFDSEHQAQIRMMLSTVLQTSPHIHYRPKCAVRFFEESPLPSAHWHCCAADTTPAYGFLYSAIHRTKNLFRPERFPHRQYDYNLYGAMRLLRRHVYRLL